MRAERQVVSLFSGAGGLDQGLELARWRIRCQIEMDEDCTATLRRHAAKRRVAPEILQSRVEDQSPEQLRRRLGLARGELGLIAAGPPCQPFTTTGLRRTIHDRRAASAFPALLDYVSEFEPSAILIENVDGLLSAALRHRPLKERGAGHPPLDWEERKGSFLRWLLEEFGRRGYSVSWGVLEAADYGVPQMRQRAFLVGVRDGHDPCFLPKPTYGRPGLQPYRTLRDALNEVEELGPIQPLSDRKAAVFAEVPPGGNWRDLGEERQRETMGAAYHASGGKSGWWRRLSWDAPAPTILGMPDHSSTALIHPDDVRCLSVNECSALQTFPLNHRFQGTSRSQYQQIGNAVPPLLGKAIGETIALWLQGRREAEPSRPRWRKTSANRRIGTHGWVSAAPNGLRFRVIAKVRDDHVWADDTHQLQLAG